MDTLAIALLAGVGFIAAYRLYGRYLARRVFGLDPAAPVPSKQLEDGSDYVPTRKPVIFGHHFTSIAGTGPIVGPAIAVFWGWLPALVWVLLGSVFIGAVHDFGSLVVSLRSRGHTIGDIAGRMINRRVQVLFLIVVFFSLLVLLAVFCLVVASIFAIYPQSVAPVWVALPLAVGVGLFFRRKPEAGILWPSLIALVLLYGAVALGAYGLVVKLGSLPLFAGEGTGFGAGLRSSVAVWTVILMIYCFFASVLPVWLLLQPRDFINSQQLYVALALLVVGLFLVHPPLVAPAVNAAPPGDAPPILPFLFITVACGAVSGFHCLVSSGTSSKQLKAEPDALTVGYGAMLLEGALAVLVILACCAGVGLGIYQAGVAELTPVAGADGQPLVGAAAWGHYYGGTWSSMGLGQKVGAFVDGAGNLVAGTGIPLPLATSIVAVMVACFAMTTLDTGTRLQRYIIQELSSALHIPVLTNKYAATSFAVLTAAVMALWPGPKGPGSGGLILWPLFGATNQLLAGLALLVVTFYLLRTNRPVWFIGGPLALMVLFPFWALGHQTYGWMEKDHWFLSVIGGLVLLLQVWMVVEGILLWRKVRGVAPEDLPPLRGQTGGPQREGGRAC